MEEVIVAHNVMDVVVGALLAVGLMCLIMAIIEFLRYKREYLDKRPKKSKYRDFTTREMNILEEIVNNKEE